MPVIGHGDPPFRVGHRRPRHRAARACWVTAASIVGQPRRTVQTLYAAGPGAGIRSQFNGAVRAAINCRRKPRRQAPGLQKSN
jgi:hypothetical protein